MDGREVSLTMRVTVIQMTPGHVVQDNLVQARDLVMRASQADRPNLIVLPEMWSCLGGTRETKQAAAERLPDRETATIGPVYKAMRDIAREYNVVLHGGSIGERADDRLYNTTVVFAPTGHELARYRKMHLFDVIAPSGAEYRESDSYLAGSRAETFRIGDMCVGCSICYDIRSPYLFDTLRSKGAELIILPAAFTAETGEAHWDILVRARAIDTQSWVAAAATTGRHSDGKGGQRSTFGHSMICDPWGTVVAQASREPGWATAAINRSLTCQVRRSMPIWQHRKTL